MANNHRNFQTTLIRNGQMYQYFDLIKFSQYVKRDLKHLPYSIRVLLEGCLRNTEKNGFSEKHAQAVINWNAHPGSIRPAVPFLPARVLMQDFTGVPVLNDLTALRAAVQRNGKDPLVVNPRIPSNLVIDHSLQVSAYGCAEARRINEQLEFDQNFERYQFMKWSQSSYDNLQVLPPGLGICHQVNLEYLGQVAFVREASDGIQIIYPDSVLGTDSHTTMINGLGVMGWGVGGIEALAAMLEYPTEFPIPDVIGVQLTGSLPDSATPTDLTLSLTAKLRELGVVGKFVEIYGESTASLAVETRAMIANMSPESGATMTYFPVDNQTIAYLERTGRSHQHVDLVREYFRAQGLFHEGTNAQIEYSQTVDFDLGKVEPVLAGPKRPQDIFSFSRAKKMFNASLISKKGLHGFGLPEKVLSKQVDIEIKGEKQTISHGAVLIAAITSCTNTSNPTVMITAALLAKNAAKKGLRCKPWVKTSFAPGSRVVNAYLEKAGLLSGLDTLGFNIVGYGCTTCIGNSGPINPSLSKAVQKNSLITASVLSGNRNFEGRIHPDIQANFLASPPLVVAYALAGTVVFDFKNTPLGVDKNKQLVFLKDIYPSRKEVKEIAAAVIHSELFLDNYADIYNSNERWNTMRYPKGAVFKWQEKSSFIKEPDFLFDGFEGNGALGDIESGYALALLGDSITTDHISPAGQISADNPAALYLKEKGVIQEDFISFGARRGNHEVMARGTFSNPRLRNKLANGVDGGFTTHIPSGEMLSIYDASQRYINDHIPLIIIAGKAYGTGSSRDWAAKGTYLLGVQAIIAESFERIHRTNLVCMGILPLQFKQHENPNTLALTGLEQFTIKGISAIDKPNTEITVEVIRHNGSISSFITTARIDTPLELAYFKAGGLMRKLRADF
ncbi:MAG: aconitate hydratase AcnA [Anaerolineaceae bacterium]|nr:aconitate hydratase AcnA [Anaerolineaceae bacterium]